MTQLGVLSLQVQDHADAGQVETRVEQVPDPAEPVKVVRAVAAGAPIGAFGFEQAAGLVQAQVLHAHADQVGSYGDAVHAAVTVGSGHCHG